MNRLCLCLLVSGLSVTFLVRGGDTNFVAALNTHWCSRDASNVLAFVDSQLATNREVETLVARGVLAAYLQEWGRGATNYFGLAIAAAYSNSSYSALGRSNVVQSITRINRHISALLESTGEATNSVPKWDPNGQAEVFGELGDQVPYFEELDELAHTP